MLNIYWDSPDGHLIGFRQSTAFREYQELLQPYAETVEESGHYRKTGVEMTKKAARPHLGAAQKVKKSKW